MATDGLVSSTIASLVNGVSQQPDELRLDSQNTAQENCLSDVVEGVLPRPGAQHVAKLTASPAASGYFYHLIRRDDDEVYFLLIEDGDLRVFDLNGDEKTVTKPGDMSYFSSPSPRSDFVAVTVADFTFIANKTVPVAMSGSPSAAAPNAFIWTVQTDSVGGSSTNVIEIDGTEYSAGHDPDRETARDAMFSNLDGIVPDWTFTKIGINVIYGEQTGNVGTPQSVKAWDTRGDVNHEMIYKQTPTFGRLPALAKDGYTVEVSGDETNKFDSFFVRFDENGGEHIWTEVAKPGLDQDFDATTMPYTLVRTPGGPDDFELTPGSWEGRAAGDEESAPEPSFVGRTIRDVVLHSNRLMFLSDENVIASEAAHFFNFWPTTATTIVDSDPLDVAATSNRVVLLDYALPFQRALTVISATGDYQGELVGRGPGELTVGTARVEERGAYAVSSLARPVAVDNSIFLPVNRDRFTGIEEYTIVEDVAVADENTAHVPHYIPGNVFKIAAASNLGTLLCLTDDEEHRVYVYRWYNQGSNRIMSSWSRWSFADSDIVRTVEFVNSVLYVLIERADGLHLFKIDMVPANTLGLDYIVYLDDLVEITGVYDSPSDTTTWTLPYDQTATGGVYRVVQAGAGFSTDVRGDLVSNIDADTGGQITATGDYSGGVCAIGREYESSVQLSQFYLKERSELLGTRPATQGRLQIRRGRVLLEATGFLEVEVTHDQDSEVHTYPFTGVTVGASPVGPVVPTDARFDFDVGGENHHVRITFKSSSYLPWRVTSVEWEGYLARRGTRV